MLLFRQNKFQIYSKTAIFGQPITLEASLNCMYGLRPLGLSARIPLSARTCVSPFFRVCCLPGILSEVLAMDLSSTQDCRRNCSRSECYLRVVTVQKA
jgi:hypothetical protein